MADLARRTQLEQRIERPAMEDVLHLGRREHPAMHLHNVDVLGLQPFEAGVDAVNDALMVQLVPDLAGQHAVLAAGLHHLADERLTVAVAVRRRGVDIVDATGPARC